MGAQLRVYRRRIKSVQSTKKITKAMELIAASRIAKAQARMRAARPYAEELTRALAAVLQDGSLKHPMLTGVESPRRVGVLVITSDRGLAGGYSANALKAANELAATLEGEGKEVVRYVIGRKGTSYYNFRRLPIAGSWTGFSEQPSFADIRDATELLEFSLTATSEGEVTRGEETTAGIDELYLVYTQFKNSVTQVAVAEQLSPVKSATESAAKAEGEASPEGTEAEESVSYEFEPDPKELISALLPRYISSRIFSALLESAASESAARRRAMKSASDNATELISTYTRLANQARQAEITQEISEIVGGADALSAAGSDE
ncbi:F0F1 ATP synthase subunit gamma [Jatrophihabitans sp.]|uniref:F0F1 ATP synthase subunit gamma n=1 Tax=Jatrophihabitans sp. TaxID=1932789 RepID=UPI0030C70579|nr:synthase gamma chain [Jatrophihabitans sp.]